jgi:microcystin-dependent protein
MQIGEGASKKLITVRWYKTTKPPPPHPHVYWSHNWTPTADKPWWNTQEAGEDYESLQPWANGAAPPAMPCTGPRGSADAWAGKSDGLPLYDVRGYDCEHGGIKVGGVGVFGLQGLGGLVADGSGSFGSLGSGGVLLGGVGNFGSLGGGGVQVGGAGVFVVLGSGGVEAGGDGGWIILGAGGILCDGEGHFGALGVGGVACGGAGAAGLLGSGGVAAGGDGAWGVLGSGGVDLGGEGEWSWAVPITGEVIEYAGTSVPTGYLACNGAAVSRTTYAALFAVIGTTWGAGDGSTTFNVPDFQGRSSVGSGSGSGLTPRTIAAGGGEENHVLTIGELATHTHGPLAGTGFFCATGVPTLGAGAVPINVGATTGATGTSTAHNTMHPWKAILKVIKT